jgi:hypothetical protein
VIERLRPVCRHSIRRSATSESERRPHDFIRDHGGTARTCGFVRLTTRAVNTGHPPSRRGPTALRSPTFLRASLVVLCDFPFWKDLVDRGLSPRRAEETAVRLVRAEFQETAPQHKES